MKLEQNKLVEIEDLQVGDEILISCQSFFKYLRVKAKPRLKPKGGTTYYTNKPLYVAVRCTSRKDVVTHNYINWQGKQSTWTSNKWIVTGDDHNVTISQDLNNRQIWLVKREEE